MMARNAASQTADHPMAQQQKILLYVMPIFLAAISINFPLGILLYWVTTNIWQVAQQAIILREVKHEVEAGTLATRPGGSGHEGAGPAPRRSPGASSGKRVARDSDATSDDADTPNDSTHDDDTDDDGDQGPPPSRPRLPRRGGGR
jgi:YidC/Oxa1 family membrane protein insertase